MKCLQCDIYTKNPNISCAKCNYDKHIEICHIKDIKDFADDALISEINSPFNLVGLCRNCHWELHNNLISL